MVIYQIWPHGDKTFEFCTQYMYYKIFQWDNWYSILIGCFSNTKIFLKSFMTARPGLSQRPIFLMFMTDIKLIRSIDLNGLVCGV